MFGRSEYLEKLSLEYFEMVGEEMPLEVIDAPTHHINEDLVLKYLEKAISGFKKIYVYYEYTERGIEIMDGFKVVLIKLSKKKVEAYLAKKNRKLTD